MLAKKALSVIGNAHGCQPHSRLIYPPRVIAADQAKEGSQRQLAELFKVRRAFVRDLTCRYRQTGTVAPKPHGGCAVALVGKRTVADCASGLSRLNLMPKRVELCERAERTVVNVSVSTMQRAVKSLELSVKKKH